MFLAWQTVNLLTSYTIYSHTVFRYSLNATIYRIIMYKYRMMTKYLNIAQPYVRGLPVNRLFAKSAPVAGILLMTGTEFVVPMITQVSINVAYLRQH